MFSILKIVTAQVSCNRLCCAFLVAILCSTAVAANVGQAEKTVLLLNSYHPGLSWTDDITSAIKQTFQASGQPIQLHVEYLDTKRYPDSGYQNKYLDDYFSYKLKQIEFDLVIVSDNNAYGFALKHRDDFFADTPIVFCGVNGFLPEQIATFKDITGVAETPDLEGTLTIAQKLHPRAKELVVVGTTKDLTGQQNFAQFVKTEPLFPNLEFKYLNDLYMADLLEQVADLQADQLLFISSTVKGHKGRLFSFKETAEMLRKASSVPIYGSWDFFLGHGILGGKLINGQAQGGKAAQMAAQILNGIDPDDLPVVSVAGTRFMFDYNELQRFGIDQAQLPAESVIINQPLSFYSIDKNTVFGSIVITVLLVLLSLILVRQMLLLKKSGESLSASEDRFRQLIEQAPEAIVVYDVDLDCLVDCNSNATKLFGCCREELLKGGPQRFYAPEQPDNLPVAVSIANHNQQALAGETLLFERTILQADGQEIYCEVRLVKLPSENRRLTRASFFDITERVASEKENLELQKRLQQALKMEAVGTMAGGIAHDFNNLLAIILGNAEIIQRKLSTGKPAERNLEHIKNATGRAIDLVKQILTFSRQEKQQLIPVDLSIALDDVLKLLRSTLPSSVEILRQGDSEPIFIRADTTQLQQVFINLYTNAAHAMDEKGLIKVSLEELELATNEIPSDTCQQAGTYAKLSISDTGRGIDKETIGKIFDPFFTTKSVGKGTGMGLSVVHGIVEQYGGFIVVDSTVGQGTTFHVYFPALQEIGPEAKAVSKRLLPYGTERILFVDDEEHIATTCNELLKTQGYKVTSVTSSTNALDIFKANPDSFDLVLTDQTMPEMTGVELAVELLKAKPGLPIILCSGFSAKVTEGDAKKVGIRKFCMKPMSEEQLATVVRSALEEGASVM